MRSLYARPWTVSLLGAGLLALCVWTAGRCGSVVAAGAVAGPEAARPAATAATAPAGAISAPARPAAATTTPATTGLAKPLAAVATTDPASAPAGLADKSAAKLPLRDDHSHALPTLPDSPSGGVLGKTAAYAIVILLLGAVAMVLAKRFVPRFQPAGGGRIKVVDSAYLGPRKQLHVVHVGPQRFLLASCRDSVTMISELTRSFAEALEASKAEAGAEAGTAQATPPEGKP
jgi:flagellar biosynthetic protein FliO